MKEVISKGKLTYDRNAPQLFISINVLQHLKAFGYRKVNFSKDDINVSPTSGKNIYHLSGSSHRSN